MKKTMNKALALVIIVVMLISMFPILAFADDGNLACPQLCEKCANVGEEGCGHSGDECADCAAIEVARKAEEERQRAEEERLRLEQEEKERLEKENEDQGQEQQNDGGEEVAKKVTVNFYASTEVSAELFGQVTVNEGDLIDKEELDAIAAKAASLGSYSWWNLDKDAIFNTGEAVVTADGVVTVNVYPKVAAQNDPEDGEGAEFEGGIGLFSVTTVEFYVNGILKEELTQQVSIGGVAQKPAKDPDIPSNMVGFRGWYTDPLAGDEDSPYDFATAVPAEGLKLYAKFYDTYLVKFVDGSETGRITRKYSPGASVNAPTAGEMSGFVAPDGEHFDYWYREDDPTQTAVQFPVTASKDETFYAKYSKEYMIFFISAGSQVDPNPQYVDAGKKVTKPADPTRYGYNFRHWATEEDGAVDYFASNPDVTKNVDLYAVWTPVEVDYTVVFWLEIADFDGEPAPGNRDQYNAVHSITKRGLAGTQPNLTAADLTAQMTASNLSLKYSDIQQITNPTISGTGTTVVNVYCARKIYTFTFDLKNISADTTMTIGGQTYTGNGEKYVIEAKYEQYIGDVFPFIPTAEFSRPGYYFRSWLAPYGSWLSIRPYVEASMLSSDGQVTEINVPADWTTSSNFLKGRYYVEALPHQIADSTITKYKYNGKWYVELTDLYQETYNTGWAAKSLNGMNTISSGGITWESFEDGYRPKENDLDRYYMYNRKTYTLTFNLLAPTAEVTQIPSRTLMFEERLGTIGKPEDPVREGYTFKGWYLDEDFREKVYWEKDGDNDATIMPNANLTIFAMWESKANTRTYYDLGLQSAALGTQGCATYEVKEFLTRFDGISIDYAIGTAVEGRGVFQGWEYYVGSRLVKLSDETPVTGSVDLYASWKTTGFEVKYDAGVGSGTVPVDVPGVYSVGQTTRVLDGSSLVAPTDMIFYAWKLEGDTTGRVYYPNNYLTINNTAKLIAQYLSKGNSKTLQYHSNYPESGVSNTTRDAIVARGEKVQLLDATTFTYSGWMIEKWAKNANGSGETFAPGSMNLYTTQNDDSTEHLYAIWVRTTDHTVKFQVVNGSFATGTTTTFIVPQGKSMSQVTDFAVPSPSQGTDPNYIYTPKGWYVNYGTSGEAAWNPLSGQYDIVTEDMVITYVYEITPAKVSVTFKYRDSNGAWTESSKTGILRGTDWVAAGITVPNEPNTPTQIFTGWTVTPAGYNPDPTANGAINDDLVFTAKYRNRATWTINFKVDSDSNGRGTVTNTTLTFLEGRPLSTATGWTSSKPTATTATATATDYFTFTKWYGPGTGGGDLSTSNIFDAGSYVPAANGETIYAAFGVNSKTALTITGNTGSYVYNGSVQTVTGANVIGLKTGHAVYYKNAPIASASVNATDWTNGNKAMGLNWADIDIRDGGVSVKEQYTGSVTDGWINITKRPITITIGHDDTKFWTDSPVTANLSVTPQTASGDAGLISGHSVLPLTVLASRTNTGTTYYGDDAGSEKVTIKISSGSDTVTDNYNINIVDGWLTVKPLGGDKGLKVNLSDNTFVYDGTDKSLANATVAFGGPSSTATIHYREVGEATWSTTMPTRQNAGSYVIEAFASAPGYVDSEVVSKILLIKPFPITVQPQNNSKTFGENDPTPLTTNDITTKPTAGVDLTWPAGALDLSRVSGEKVGDYALTVAAGTNSALATAVVTANPNYEFFYKAGNFRINPRKIVIEIDPVEATLEAAASKIYGKIDPALTITLPNDLPAPISGEPLTASMFKITREPGEKVGIYKLFIDGLDDLQTKYVESYEFVFSAPNSRFEILPRPVNVSVRDQAKVYGENDPDFDYSFVDRADSGIADLAGFNLTTDFATLGITVARSAAHADRENANDDIRGNKDTEIVLVATGVSAGINGNYEFLSLTSGNLIINRRLVYIQANSRGPITVDGNTHAVSGYSILPAAGASGLLAEHVLDTSTVTAYAAASTAGDHTVYVVIASTGAVIKNGGVGDNLAGNYQLIGRNGLLRLVNPAPVVTYLGYTINYYSDAIGAGGTFLGSVSGTAPEGSTIPVTANYYRSTAMVNAGYGSGLVYGSRIMTTNGQVINVLYTTGGGEEEELPPEEEEELEEPEVPEANEPGEEELEEPDVPEAPPASWALLNLILAIVTVIIGIILLIGIFRRNKKDEDVDNADYTAEDEGENGKSGIIWRVFGMITAVLSPIVFFLTENMSNPMVFTDKWTLLMGLILLVQVIAVLLMRYVRNKDEDERKENI